MLGLLLAKRGADVLVLEGHENFDREFRGEVLQPSTAHLLDELGLLQYVLAQPHSLLDAGRVRLNGREIGAFFFKRIAPEYPYAIWMPQPIFLDALQRKAQPFPSFKCWMGAKVTELVEEGGRVVGVKGRRHGSEPFEVRADVVVGADGRYSAVARLGGFETEYEHHDFDVIWFTIDQPPGWSSTFYVSLSKVRGLMLPKYPQQIQAGILLPTGEWRRWRQDGVAAVAERVRRSTRSSRAFAASLTDFKPFFPLEGIIRFVRDWARDGLLLIGDAAHTMSPMGAIGVNVAIATAAVAAQVLLPASRQGAHPARCAGRGPAAPRGRRAHVAPAPAGAQNVLAAGRGSRNPIMKWLAPRLLPILLRSPLLPRIQRRIFFGAPLPPLDPAFSFREPARAAAVS